MSWFIQSMQNELFVLHISGSTILRDPKKYTWVVIKSYLMWILDINRKAIRLNQWLRIAYSIWRYVDDIADGDRNLPLCYQSVEHFLDDLSQSLDTQSTQYPLLWNVINRTVRDIYKISQYDIWPELTDFFVGMKMEYMRRINKSILSKNEIEKIFNSGFRGPQQIYLVWLGSEYTIDDIHELPIILWRVYSLRDLEWDLNNWICNIPYEILDIMWYKLIPRYSEIKNHHLLNVWIVEVCQEQRNNIDLLKNKIQYMDIWVKKICWWLLPAVENVLDRLLNVN